MIAICAMHPLASLLLLVFLARSVHIGKQLISCQFYEADTFVVKTLDPTTVVPYIASSSNLKFLRNDCPKIGLNMRGKYMYYT